MLTITMRRWRKMKGFGAAARALSALAIATTLAGLPQLFFVAPVAAAGEPAAFTNVSLSIYPEYDDPRLLVMLEGSLPAGSTVPANVRFLVPAGAEMYSAGSIDTKGTYKGGPPDRKASGVPGWDEISYSLTTSTFRVEYYADSIKGLPEKTIDYEFRTLYPIDSLQIEVLQPARSSGFNVTPAAQTKGTSGNLATHNYRFTNVGVDKPVTLNISYSKPDSNPSVQPGATSTSSPQGASPNLVWLLGIAGAAVIAGGAIWYSSNRRRYRPASYRSGARAARRAPVARPAPSRTSVAHGSPRSEQPAPRIGEKAAFCRKCGTKLEGSIRFCSRCGTRV